LGGDKDRLRALYQQFVTAGSFTLPDDARAALSTGFSATAVDDAHTRTAMQAAYRETGEVLCPHTGVGWQALEGVASRTASAAGQWGRPLVLLATAHAAKFPETVQDVLGVLPPLPRHCADLYERSERIERIEPNLSRLKAYIRAVRAASGPTRS
jgi:threonine synthase